MADRVEFVSVPLADLEAIVRRAVREERSAAAAPAAREVLTREEAASRPRESQTEKKPPIMASVCLNDLEDDERISTVIWHSLAMHVREHNGRYYVRGHELRLLRDAIDGVVIRIINKRAERALRVAEDPAPIGETHWERPGFVYFIQGAPGGNIKIGWALSPERRRSELQCGSPIPLSILASVPGTRELESEHHSRFAHLREHGEWFRPEPELLEYIASLSEGGSPQ